MKILSRIAVPLLSVWLLGWIVLSWGGIQDDALIHLRYADFLHRLHFITFDGVHPSYGTSSLLYVGLLAFLRTFTLSPYLSRAVSTFFHLVLFAVFAALYLRTTRRSSTPVQLLALTILFITALPSAVRWLDDGMETSLVLSAITLVICWTHRLSLRAESTPTDLAISAALGFFLVILRNELAIIAFFATFILSLSDAGHLDRKWLPRLVKAIPTRIAFLVGGLLASLSIRLVMHSFLPDTALAKAHGLWFFHNSILAGAMVLPGALLFGMATAGLWLLSAVTVLFDRNESASGRRLATLAANLLFPFVVLLSALRGQEMQGVRYVVWTFFFSIAWNLLELKSLDSPTTQMDHTARRNGRPAVFGLTAFLILCVLFLPEESRLMARVLTTRARTMKLFLSQDLPDALPGQLGIATDVGYIAFYTQDNICDSAGLVNGRAAAAMTEDQRAPNCVAQHPGFAFVNSGQAITLTKYLDFKAWPICATYDFGNMRTPDRHYLLVRPDLAPAACKTLGNHPSDSSAALLTTAY